MLVTITAIDSSTSETMSRTFNINDSLKTNIVAWESTIPFRRYELICNDLIETTELEELFNILEITY